jgi:hypothetical protein
VPELLDSTNEEEDKNERKYRIMTNCNHVGTFYADEIMADIQCDESIQEAFAEKGSKAQSRFLSDNDDDK